ncbi:MAG TPA: CoA pyrophosphatase [Thermoanaerobaculia bacterium]|nr:CoA pyrophosphatase [Thermoanaerobaculia bacterium]
MTEAAPWILEIRRRLEREWVVPDVVREIAEGTPDARPAAVLVPLYVRERELWTLLTKRSETVESHRGQIAFPGGMEALDDASPWETAIRETEEEIGLPRKAILRIGELPGVTTFTGFRIRAFVGAIPYPFDVRHDPREVDSVIQVPVRALMGPTLVEERAVSWKGRSIPTPVYHLKGHVIWGATAFLVSSLLEALVDEGRPPA